MAVTQGQGNPDWTEEETILALDLYLSSGRKAINKHDARVIELSALLQRIPWPDGTTKNAKFRNNEGVSMKVYNLRSVDLGRGLRNTIMDRAVFGKYADKPEEVSRLASEIRDAILGHTELLARELQGDDDDTPYPEGRILAALHRSRERNPKLRQELLKQRKRRGALHCEMCMWGQGFAGEDFVSAVLEAHHLVPLYAKEARETRLSDLALLCANCHRLIHRAIAKTNQWLTIAACRDMLQIVQTPSGFEK